MSFGLQIINDRGMDIVAGSRNAHMLDYFQITGPGSKAYPVDADERLVASVVIMGQGGSNVCCTDCTISGNVVSWATGSYGPNIMTMVVTKETI